GRAPGSMTPMSKASLSWGARPTRSREAEGNRSGTADEKCRSSIRPGPVTIRGMPEYPDVTVYLECLAPRILGQPLEKVRIGSPFVLRSVEPPVAEVEGKRVLGLRRIGKRLVLAMERENFLVIHLMIAGRLRWRPSGTAIPKKLGLAAFDFPTGTLLLTEAGTKKRAS